MSLREVYDLSLAALRGSGASLQQAGPVAESIRDAEAQGIRNVGLGYLPVYCAHLRCGKVNGQAVPHVTQSAPSWLRVDAGHGFCHPAFVQALPLLLEMTRRNGVAAMAIANSYSAGVVGWFVEKLAAEGLVALAFANTSPCIAPWGGNKALFGTNPIAFAAPLDDTPVVVDMAASATARVNIVSAASKGERVPATWLVDAHGVPTSDPNALKDGATMSPLGGAKGYGLALMVEIMAAGLTGANWSYQASSFSTDEGGPPAVGQMFIALSPALTGAAGFGDRLGALAEKVHEQSGARLPGERRHAHRVVAASQGVSVPEDLIEVLIGLSA
ncbi:MAG: Ldh family oxidoreductase [Proteobacteria bacterium]|nr:Ldh family oxidoreductase [Pseudomonadota bacterium]